MLQNEDIAKIILRLDPSAINWVYNNYCSICGRFLYVDDLARERCKKCESGTDSKITRPIPFLTSGTATEKLLEWVRQSTANKIIQDDFLIDNILDITEDWLDSIITTSEYHKQIAQTIYDTLKKATS